MLTILVPSPTVTRYWTVCRPPFSKQQHTFMFALTKVFRPKIVFARVGKSLYFRQTADIRNRSTIKSSTTVTGGFLQGHVVRRRFPRLCDDRVTEGLFAREVHPGSGFSLSAWRPTAFPQRWQLPANVPVE